ncbi:hypothetical protein ACWD5R_36745 [Streptomyces sp. NPDC002514]
MGLLVLMLVGLAVAVLGGAAVAALVGLAAWTRSRLRRDRGAS